MSELLVMLKNQDAQAAAQDAEDAHHHLLASRVAAFEKRAPTPARRGGARMASWLAAVSRTEEGLVSHAVGAWRGRERVAVQHLGDRPSKLRQWRARNPPPVPSTLFDWSRPPTRPAAFQSGAAGAGAAAAAAAAQQRRPRPCSAPARRARSASAAGSRRPPPLAAMLGSRDRRPRPPAPALVRSTCSCGIAGCCGWAECTWAARRKKGSRSGT